MPGVMNGLSIDVEEYFQVESAQGVIAPSDWGRWPSRVEAATDTLLGLLAEHRTQATFFVLGWVGERHPGLVRQIAAAGHEVACHGYAHEHLRALSPRTFRADVHRAKRLLEDLTGTPVLGYRAPTFSIQAATMWAVDVLGEEGFLYDSSIFPVHHDRYGVPEAPRRPYLIERAGGRLVELPPLTARLAGVNLPMAGGGYLRLLPAGAVLWAIRRMNAARHPAIIYLHPWEVDPGQPMMPLGRLSTWRHRLGLGRTMGKLRCLLRAACFGPLAPLARDTLTRYVKTPRIATEAQRHRDLHPID